MGSGHGLSSASGLSTRGKDSFRLLLRRLGDMARTFGVEDAGAEDAGAEGWFELSISGAQPVAAGECGRDEGERGRGEARGDGGPDERGLELVVPEQPPSSCGATHMLSDG